MLQAGPIELVALRHVVPIRQGGDRRGLCEAVYVERLAHPIQQVGNRGMHQTETDPKRRQSVRLGEGAGEHQVWKPREPAHAVVLELGRQIFVVRFVEHHDDPRRN